MTKSIKQNEIAARSERLIMAIATAQADATAANELLREQVTALAAIHDIKIPEPWLI